MMEVPQKTRFNIVIIVVVVVVASTCSIKVSRTGPLREVTSPYFIRQRRRRRRKDSGGAFKKEYFV